MKMIWLLLALFAGTVSLSLHAGKDLSAGQIRALVKEGEILSLETILEKNKQRLKGRLLDLEVEMSHGKVIYEMEFMLENGNVLEVEIDARTGQLLEQEINK